jgi:hypothetical protein
MSSPAILAVGTRENWRGVEVTYDGYPDTLGVLLLLLLRRHGGLKSVAREFVSAPWGWRSLPGREAREDGWAPWFTPDDEYCRMQFVTWFVLDLEGNKLEVYDVTEKQWLEPALIGADGRALNRPAWVPEAPRWLPTRPSESNGTNARILEVLGQQGLSIERARAVVSAWLSSLVPRAQESEWELSCSEEATSWSPYTLAGRRLWIPDHPNSEGLEVIVSTEDGHDGYGSSLLEPWWEAAKSAGISEPEVEKTLEALFSAAASPGTQHPVRVGVAAVPPDSSGPAEPLRTPLLIQVLPAFSPEEWERRLEEGDIPDSIVQDDEGIHPAEELTPPTEWLVNLIRALSVPEEPLGMKLPQRRRAFFWPYDEA